VTVSSKNIRAMLVASFLTVICTACSAQPITIETTFDIPKSIIPNIKGKLSAKFRFKDVSGSHFLALTRQSTKLSDGTDKITLQALQYDSSNSGWKQEWVINDNISCKDLDLDAEFIVPLTSISDKDSNGVAETSVAYHLACLGGIDTKPTKAIMRQGQLKYAVRGESLVQIEGTPSFGGTFAADSSLDKKPELKSHLISIWKMAAKVK
jgi:hypothetical protein